MDTLIAPPVVAPAIEVKQEVAQPPMYAVVLHNDSTTEAGFVQRVLCEVFKLSEDQAWSLMMEVHRSNRGVVHVVTKEIAEQELHLAKTMIDGPSAVFDDESTNHCELTFTMEAE